ncbi:MAG: serine hydrolase domain-containing protein [Wenzhouxiangella sp.]|nr:serine hydrolase domain-containing protein [Wenzhouxiangella sp.]
MAEDNGATNETGNKRNETDTASLAADLELKAYVDGLLATWQFAYGGPGHTVAVVRPDRNVLTKGYGLADVERGTPVDASSTRFHVASISKTFVWTAAMMLVDRGSLDLNADVNTYLKRYKAPAGERPLTLHDLMSHRAGVEENLDLFSVEVAEMERSEALAATEPEQVFARGTRAAYSNWGSNLVALIIEDATGRDYAEFLSTEILQPLGMSTTALTDESPAAMDPSTPVAKNYWVSASGPQERAQLDLGSFAPIGGMTTTAADMARWMRFHLNRGELDGVRLISEEGYATLRSRAFDPMPGAAGRASGFADIPFRSVVSYGHTGSINEFLSKFAIAPELGLGVFIAQNSSNHFDPLDSVPSLVFDRALAMRGENIPVALVTDAKPEDIEAAEEVAGRYMTSRRVFSGPLKILAAMDGVMKLSAQDGLLVGRHPSAPFARIAPDLWENRFGQRLAFVRGEDGSVEHVITPAGASDAVPVDWRSDPMLLGIAFGATALFSLTTWLGFWRRFRQQHETRRTGTLLSATALLATLPVVWMIVLATQVPGPDELAFADVFSDWPIPFLGQLALSATVVAGTAIILTVCLVPAWARSGWNVARRLHFTLFAMAYATLAVFLAIWGLVPYSAG